MVDVPFNLGASDSSSPLLKVRGLDRTPSPLVSRLRTLARAYRQEDIPTSGNIILPDTILTLPYETESSLSVLPAGGVFDTSAPAPLIIGATSAETDGRFIADPRVCLSRDGRIVADFQVCLPRLSQTTEWSYTDHTRRWIMADPMVCLSSVRVKALTVFIRTPEGVVLLRPKLSQHCVPCDIATTEVESSISTMLNHSVQETPKPLTLYGDRDGMEVPFHSGHLAASEEIGGIDPPIPPVPPDPPGPFTVSTKTTVGDADCEGDWPRPPIAISTAVGPYRSDIPPPEGGFYFSDMNSATGFEVYSRENALAMALTMVADIMTEDSSGAQDILCAGKDLRRILQDGHAAPFNHVSSPLPIKKVVQEISPCDEDYDFNFDPDAPKLESNDILSLEPTPVLNLSTGISMVSLGDRSLHPDAKGVLTQTLTISAEVTPDFVRPPTVRRLRKDWRVTFSFPLTDFVEPPIVRKITSSPPPHVVPLYTLLDAKYQPDQRWLSPNPGKVASSDDTRFTPFIPPAFRFSRDPTYQTVRLELLGLGEALYQARATADALTPFGQTPGPSGRKGDPYYDTISSTQDRIRKTEARFYKVSWMHDQILLRPPGTYSLCTNLCYALRRVDRTASKELVEVVIRLDEPWVKRNGPRKGRAYLPAQEREASTSRYTPIPRAARRPIILFFQGIRRQLGSTRIELPTTSAKFTAMTRKWRGVPACIMAERWPARLPQRDAEAFRQERGEAPTSCTPGESSEGRVKGQTLETDVSLTEGSEAVPHTNRKESSVLNQMHKLAKGLFGFGPLCAHTLVASALLLPFAFPVAGAGRSSDSSGDSSDSSDEEHALEEKRNKLIPLTGELLVKHSFHHRLTDAPFNIALDESQAIMLDALAHAAPHALIALHEAGVASQWAHTVRGDTVYNALSPLVSQYTSHKQKKAKRGKKSHRHHHSHVRDRHSHNHSSRHPSVPTPQPVASSSSRPAPRSAAPPAPLLVPSMASTPAPTSKRQRLAPTVAGTTPDCSQSVYSEVGSSEMAYCPPQSGVSTTPDPVGWSNLGVYGRNEWSAATKESWVLLQNKMDDHISGRAMEIVKLGALQEQLPSVTIRHLTSYHDQISQMEYKIEAISLAIGELENVMKEFMLTADAVAKDEQSALRRLHKDGRGRKKSDPPRLLPLVMPLQAAQPGDGPLALVSAAEHSAITRADHEAGGGLEAGFGRKRTLHGEMAAPSYLPHRRGPLNLRSPSIDVTTGLGLRPYADSPRGDWRLREVSQLILRDYRPCRVDTRPDVMPLIPPKDIRFIPHLIRAFENWYRSASRSITALPRTLHVPTFTGFVWETPPRSTGLQLVIGFGSPRCAKKFLAYSGPLKCTCEAVALSGPNCFSCDGSGFHGDITYAAELRVIPPDRLAGAILPFYDFPRLAETILKGATGNRTPGDREPPPTLVPLAISAPLSTSTSAPLATSHSPYAGSHVLSTAIVDKVKGGLAQLLEVVEDGWSDILQYYLGGREGSVSEVTFDPNPDLMSKASQLCGRSVRCPHPSPNEGRYVLLRLRIVDGHTVRGQWYGERSIVTSTTPPFPGDMRGGMLMLRLKLHDVETNPTLLGYVEGLVYDLHAPRIGRSLLMQAGELLGQFAVACNQMQTCVRDAWIYHHTVGVTRHAQGVHATGWLLAEERPTHTLPKSTVPPDELRHALQLSSLTGSITGGLKTVRLQAKSLRVFLGGRVCTMNFDAECLTGIPSQAGGQMGIPPRTGPQSSYRDSSHLAVPGADTAHLVPEGRPFHPQAGPDSDQIRNWMSTNEKTNLRQLLAAAMRDHNGWSGSAPTTHRFINQEIVFDKEHRLAYGGDPRSEIPRTWRWLHSLAKPCNQTVPASPEVAAYKLRLSELFKDVGHRFLCNVVHKHLVEYRERPRPDSPGYDAVGGVDIDRVAVDHGSDSETPPYNDGFPRVQSTISSLCG